MVLDLLMDRIGYIGLCGGNSVFTVYKPQNMLMFFNWVEVATRETNKNCDYSLISKSLYRRYLDVNELEGAFVAAEKLEDAFSKIVLKEIEDIYKWDHNEFDIENSKNLRQLFGKFFSNFYKAIDRVKYFSDHDREKPYSLRLCIATMPNPIEKEDKFQMILDEWKGAPFWLLQYIRLFPDIDIPFDDGHKTESLDLLNKLIEQAKVRM